MEGNGMIRCNPNGDYPKIDKTTYIDPTATIIGKVKIGKNVFVAPGAVIRADDTTEQWGYARYCTSTYYN